MSLCVYWAKVRENKIEKFEFEFEFEFQFAEGPSVLTLTCVVDSQCFQCCNSSGASGPEGREWGGGRMQIFAIILLTLGGLGRVKSQDKQHGVAARNFELLI